MKVKKHYTDGLFALAVFGIFAACIILTLVTGAGVYNSTVDRDSETFRHRTCAQYIATKVRAAEKPSCVSVEEFGDSGAVCISEIFEGTGYVTRIYTWNGYLMELFSEENVECLPSEGEKLTECAGIETRLTGNILRIEFTGGKETGRELVLCLREEGGKL